jgi:hypothetical protein
MTEAFGMTLGQVVEALRPWTCLALQEMLQEAVVRRNFLAHRFWFERCHLAFTEEGVHKLIDDLTEVGAYFAHADRQAHVHFAEQSQRLGVTEEACQAAMVEMIENGKEWQAPSPQRRLRKQETIVRIWDAPTADRQLTLIFELEDGSLWQLSDTGLGWTRFSTPASDWSQNLLLKPHLPARTNPRPGVPGSWEYDLVLDSAASISVRLSRKRARTFLWHLRVEGESHGV